MSTPTAPAPAQQGTSPAQQDALAKLQDEYPATHFCVVGQEPFSCALRMEAWDAAGDHVFVITANGALMGEVGP